MDRPSHSLAKDFAPFLQQKEDISKAKLALSLAGMATALTAAFLIGNSRSEAKPIGTNDPVPAVEVDNSQKLSVKEQAVTEPTEAQIQQGTDQVHINSEK